MRKILLQLLVFCLVAAGFAVLGSPSLHAQNPASRKRFPFETRCLVGDFCVDRSTRAYCRRINGRCECFYVYHRACIK
jgi:hypothetical protein